MPTVHKIDSIKIDLYPREHLPPHFHALYVEHEILIRISDLGTYAGSLPAKQHAKVISWAKPEKVRTFLLENFKRLNKNLRT